MQVIPNKIASDLDLKDLAVAGVVKYVAERGLTPVIGNGTLLSGGIKLIGSNFASYSPVLKQPLKIALAIDGIEDIINGAITHLGGGSLGNWVGALTGGISGGNNGTNVEVI